MNRYLLLAVAAAIGLPGSMSAGCTARSPARAPRLLAHRGVHQTFTTQGLTWSSCTATLMRPPTHGFIENTLPSMRAAFEAGAEIVELDVHATADGELVVWHDHTLECRTDGHGAPEAHTLEEMRGLDLGHGYTADGGQTFPLRGTGVGLLVTLPEVFQALPDRRFLIHIKSGRPEDGDRVAEVLEALAPEARARQVVYGGSAAERVEERLPEVGVWTKQRVRSCLKGYVGLGWLGIVPSSCRDTWLVIPSNYTWLLWGFPRRLEARMERVGTEVVLAGPLLPGGISTGIDTLEQRDEVHPDFGGWLWTDRIEVLGPAAR